MTIGKLWGQCALSCALALWAGQAGAWQAGESATLRVAAPLPDHLANRGAGRKGRPEEVAATIVNLCEPEGAYVTGQSLHVNGGAYLSS